MLSSSSCPPGSGRRAVVQSLVALFSAALAPVLISACAPSEAQLRRVYPRETERFALAYIDSLRLASPAAKLAPLAGPAAVMPGVADSLARVSRFLPLGRLSARELAYVRADFTGSTRRTTVDYQLLSEPGDPASRGRPVVVELRLLEADGGRWVEAVHVQSLERPLEYINRFDPARSPAALLSLLAMVGILGLTLVTMGLVATTRGMPKRWLWVLVGAVGAGKWGLNWTTGAVMTQLLSVQFLGVSVGREGMLGPWVVWLSFPVGAVLALRRRAQFLRREQAAPPAPEQAASAGPAPTSAGQAGAAG